MKRFRLWLESIVFAGLRPSGPGSQPAPAPTTRSGRMWQRINHFISGGTAPSDPLYLTNRTWGQKIRSWSIVGVPLLLLIGGVGLMLSHYLDPPEAKPQAELTAAEVAAKILPNIKDLRIDQNRTLEVVEVHIERTGGVRMVGTVKNLTSREVDSAEISCDLTDNSGTQLGSVSAAVDKVPASGTKRFELTLKQPAAAFVLVREIVTK